MSSASSSSQSLGLSALVVSLGTLSSRILGLIRDMALASVFGASRVTDVFFIAFQIPSMFRKLLGEGALSSSVVPVVTDMYQTEGEQRAQALSDATFTWGLIVVSLLSGAGILLAPLLVSLIAPGFVGTGYFSLAVQLTRVLFPFLICMSAASVAMGVLHARKRFAPSAFAPAVFNLCMIASILWLAPRLGRTPEQKIWAVASGVLVGGLFQFLVQWWALRREGVGLRWNPSWNVPGLRRILTMMGPMVLGMGVGQLIIFVDRMVASFLDPGNISHLYYSNRLFQFPFALVGIAFGTVVLPETSRLVSEDQTAEVARTARESLEMMSFLMIPSVVGLWLIGEPLIGVLFRSSQFTRMDQTVTYWTLFYALIGLFAYGFIRIFVSLCYSYEDTVGPLQAVSAALLINGILDVLFVVTWPTSAFRVCGLTLAGSIAVWVQAWILRRRLTHHLPDISIVPWGSMVRHCLLASLMGGILLISFTWIYTEGIRVLFGCLVGVCVYFVMSHLAGDTLPLQLVREIRSSLYSRFNVSEG